MADSNNTRLTAEEQKAAIRARVEDNYAVDTSDDAFFDARDLLAALDQCEQEAKALITDLDEALSQRHDPRVGICAACGVNHINEARLNRAVLVGIRSRLRRVFVVNSDKP